MDPREALRLSWNTATRNHNAHKGDQAAALRAGADTLFEEELALLGPLEGRQLVHLQCNAGQDSLCLARRGAVVTGVDLSDEAIGFARRLSAQTGLPATFFEAELLEWLHSTALTFDVAFSSYGAVGWIPDLDRWAQGIARVLRPGGRFVYVEFHPLVWSIGADSRLSGDDYFATQPFVEPVSDYVAESGPGLSAPVFSSPLENSIGAPCWQHGLGQIVTALVRAGLLLEKLEEYPHANGCRVNRSLVLGEDRRWRWPEGASRVPLMFGLACRRPAA